MDKKQKIVTSTAISQLKLTVMRYIYLIFWATLTTALSFNSAVAADRVVSEKQQNQLSSSQKLEKSSSASEIPLQMDTHLRQKLLASKKSNTIASANPSSVTNISTYTVQQPQLSISLISEKFSTDSENVSKMDANLGKQLLLSQNSHTKLQSKTKNQSLNQAANSQILSRRLRLSALLHSFSKAKTTRPETVLKLKKPQLIAQIDSSGTVGDTLGEINKLRQELLIEPIVTLSEFPKAAPGSTAGTPSGYGASFGQAYIGGGLSFPFDSDRDRVDGSLSLGFGLGDAVKSVGLEVNVNITSVGGGGDTFDFGDSGGLGLKLHKYFTDGTAVAIGWSNPIKWGDSNASKDTFYGVVTKAFPLQPDNPNNKLPLTISVGLGSGSFRSKGAIEADENSLNVFGSLGLRVIPEVALVSSWTGNRLNMGASFAPFQKLPIVINTIFTDVTSNLETGPGFTLSAGYIFRF